MKKVRLGIIGLGVFFKKMHWPVLQGLKHRFSVEGVYTSDTAKFRELKKAFPSVKYFSDLSSLLKDKTIEAVVACVPIPQHYRIGAQVIRARKALLLEKPLAANLRQGAGLIRLSQKERVPFMVAESFYYFPHFQKLRTVLKSKVLGKIEFIQVQALKRFDSQNPYYQTQWRIGPAGYPGILWDAGIHAVSLLGFLFGPFKVRYKSLRSYNRRIGRRDTILAHLTFGNVDSSFLMSYALFGRDEHFLTIYGEKGRIKCGINSFSVETTAKIRTYKSTAPVYPKIYDDFYHVIRQRKKPLYALQNAYQDLKALDSLVNR